MFASKRLDNDSPLSLLFEDPFIGQCHSGDYTLFLPFGHRARSVPAEVQLTKGVLYAVLNI